MVLVTELLREAMDRTRECVGGALAMLKTTIATAEEAEGVDGAVLQEAKTLLVTQPLRKAMEQREVVRLRAAIEVAEGNADVDRAIVEVSKCAHAGTRADMQDSSRNFLMEKNIRGNTRNFS